MSVPGAEARAERDRRVHHQLVDLAFDAMFTRAFADRTITSWNEGAERLYGWTRREALGKQPALLLCSEYPIPLEQIEQQLVDTGRWEGQVLQRRKDGSPVVVDCRWGLETDAAGKPHAILEINSDLTKQRDTAARLLQSEERFSLLVSAVVDYAIFMLDPTGIVLTWNEGAERIKGYRAEEIIGRHFSVFYPPEDREALKPQRGLEIAARDGRFDAEGWRVRKDGSRFWASVVITALRDETGRLRGFGKVTRDITDRHNEEERLRVHARRMAELEHAKTEFMDLAAHELRAPLTLIRGYNSLMREGGLPLERLPEIATLLEGKLEQIDLLVEQMLEIGRLETDRAELNLESLDLQQLTLVEIDKFRGLRQGHDIRLSDASRPASAFADRRRISTIVGNLIDNAIKYSPDGGDIVCEAGTGDGRVYVSVIDRGLGIAPDHMALLFRRFTRLPTVENKSIPGTGLALYICQEIAHTHGGEIVVKSVLHEGSEFTLWLPADGAEKGVSASRGRPS